MVVGAREGGGGGCDVEKVICCSVRFNKDMIVCARCKEYYLSLCGSFCIIEPWEPAFF